MVKKDNVPQCKSCDRNIKALCIDCLLDGVRNRVEHIVMGTLRGTINAHGPITYDLLSSAAKRITSQIYATTRQLNKEVHNGR